MSGEWLGWGLGRWIGGVWVSGWVGWGGGEVGRGGIGEVCQPLRMCLLVGLFRWYPFFFASIDKEPSFPFYIPLLQPLTTVIPDTATQVATHIHQFIERKKDTNKHWGLVMPTYSKWASKFVDSGAD